MLGIKMWSGTSQSLNSGINIEFLSDGMYILKAGSKAVMFVKR
jgi:hypothetical protein